jgi:hypothetical protein
LLESVLERAKDTGRFLEVPENCVVEASVVGSPCEYERNPYFVAVLGKEMASVNAELLRNKKYTTGKLHLLSADIVRKKAVNSLSVIRPVGLGGDDCDGIYGVDAGDRFDDGGRARGVRPSAQSEGGAQ